MKHLMGCMLFAWFSAASMSGCGGESDTPAEKCDALVDEVCDRAVECVPDIGTHEACVQMIQQIIPCEAATGVSATYDGCMDQLSGNSCSVLFPVDPATGEAALSLPDDCAAVIQAERKAAALPASLDAVSYSARR